MPRLAKRARARDDSEEEEEEEEEPRNTQRRQTQTHRPSLRRRSTPPVDDEEVEESYGGDGGGNTPRDKVEKRARKLVRYALACSYSRTNIRRMDVVKKVMDDEVSLFVSYEWQEVRGDDEGEDIRLSGPG